MTDNINNNLSNLNNNKKSRLGQLFEESKHITAADLAAKALAMSGTVSTSPAEDYHHYGKNSKKR